MSQYKHIIHNNANCVQAEEWKLITFAPKYEVSSFGRVRSIDRSDSVGRLKKGKLLNPLNATKGYKSVNLHYLKDGESYRKTWLIHRLVAIMFLPMVENRPYVNHIDSNKANNNISNLEWCTPSENNIHAAKNYTASRQFSKDIHEKVLELNNSGYTRRQIAKEVSVPYNSIHKILRRMI